MKIALIVTPYPLEEFPSPPLGLCYVAAAFENGGAEVRIFDYLVRRYTPEKLYSELKSFQPDVVGLNSVTLNFYQAASILQTVKQFFPDTITIMGGPHISFDFHNSLIQYPEIDLMVIGEGETTIQELLPVIQDRKSWHRIKGIAFSVNGKPVYTGPREHIQDLDNLPMPARHLLNLSRYQALGFPVSVITSRGCPNKCIFCQGRRMVGAKVRYRSIHSIVDEIEQILNYGFTRVNIADDFFTFNQKRVHAFCSEIQNRNLHFGWSAFARADSVNKEMLKAMLDAGCDAVLFGIESGNQKLLDTIRKRVSLDRICKAVSDCKEVGMNVFGSLIAGLPGESSDTLMETHRFMQGLKIDYGYHFLAPFPGTTVKENIEQYDLKLLTEDWSQYDANHAIASTSQLSAEEIEKFVYDYYTSAVLAEEENILKRCVNGNSNEHEHLIYLGKQKNQIIFKLLSEDTIEELCDFPENSMEGDISSQLAHKIAEVCNKKISIVEPVIREIVQSGFLKRRKENDRAFWYWTHNNQVDQLPL
ncbi:MAG: radical SAM protein [Desulfobacterales bacterium]